MPGSARNAGPARTSRVLFSALAEKLLCVDFKSVSGEGAGDGTRGRVRSPERQNQQDDVVVPWEADSFPYRLLIINPARPLPRITGMMFHFQRRIPANAITQITTANQSTRPVAGTMT